MSLQTKKAFTLVELIIVMFIITTLWLFGFSSYTGYLIQSRDVNKITKLTLFQESLDLKWMNNWLILPDDYIEVKSSSWNIIAYQWYVWGNVLYAIDYSDNLKGLGQDNHFSYYLTKDKKKFQLMTFLEGTKISLLMDNDKVNALINYSKLYIKTSWSNLWIITWVWDDINKPIQEITSINQSWVIELSWVDSNTLFQANFSEDKKIIKKGENLVYDLLTKSDSIYMEPESCDKWFIWVHWNARYNKKWFCIAKYEMSYTEKDSPVTPNSTYLWTDWNSYSYDSIKDIAVRVDYPISSITQSEAIDKCTSLWYGYHLMTNDEWMTIARDIENEKYNWSGWDLGVGFIWNGNSSDISMWCTDNSWWRIYATKTWWDDSSNLISNRTTCNEKRQLILSNWEIIWDFAWNLMEHVNKWNSIDWVWYNSWSTHLISWTGYFSWDDVLVDDTERSDYGPSELLTETWTWKWIWAISENSSTSNILIRWGSADIWVNAWIYSLSLTFTWSSIWSNVWFRCAK